MNVFALIHTVMAVIAFTLIVIFLLFGFIEGLTQSVVMLEGTEKVNSVHIPHLIERCLKEDNDYISESYLDSLNGEDIAAFCGIKEFYVKADVILYKRSDEGVDVKKWTFGPREELRYPFEIYTNIMGEDGNIHVGKIKTTLEVVE